jgi:hypothetical protein
MKESSICKGSIEPCDDKVLEGKIETEETKPNILNKAEYKLATFPGSVISLAYKVVKAPYEFVTSLLSEAIIERIGFSGYGVF